MSKKTETGAYEVGHGKPPKKSQFKKGVSGNPKGRPKGTFDLDTMVMKACATPVPMSDSKGKREVSVLEAGLWRLIDLAITKGDKGALRMLFELHGSAAAKENLKNREHESPEDDQVVVRNLLQRIARQMSK